MADADGTPLGRVDAIVREDTRSCRITTRSVSRRSRSSWIGAGICCVSATRCESSATVRTTRAFGRRQWSRNALARPAFRSDSMAAALPRYEDGRSLMDILFDLQVPFVAAERR
jgi:hypothetical protein